MCLLNWCLLIGPRIVRDTFLPPLKTINKKDYQMTHELLEKTNIGHTVNSLRKAASSNDRNEVAKLARSKCLLIRRTGFSVISRFLEGILREHI